MPNGSTDGRSPFDSLLESLLGRASEFVQGAFPKCGVCEAKAVPIRCLACDAYACPVHGHFNPKSGTVICGDCVSELLGEDWWEEEEDDGLEARDDGYPWSVLGLEEDASLEEVRKAHRKLAARYHPDRHKGDKRAEEKFKEIQKAYEVAKSILEGE